MATGTVRSYNTENGFGFITPDEGGPELTVYYDSVVAGEDHVLHPGEKVEYEATVQEFRPVAERVRHR